VKCQERKAQNGLKKGERQDYLVFSECESDGSMYQLNRYEQAGYGVSYNRTAGDKPISTITMQKM